MDAATRMLTVGLAMAGAMASPAGAQAQAAPQETPRETPDEAGARAVIETLSARLLAAPSATAVLEAWCAERGLAVDPRIVAVRVPGIDKAPSPLQRERLAVGPDEAVRYRRVRLACGPHVLSEADNWYVPGRLTPEMNAALDGTQAPFGRVVRPLNPSRRNLSLRMLWRPGEGTVPGPDAPLFSVEAVLSTGGVPFCEVAETYTGAVLARGER
jgi:chorismate-pyruvate lyase